MNPLVEAIAIHQRNADGSAFVPVAFSVVVWYCVPDLSFVEQNFGPECR